MIRACSHWDDYLEKCRFDFECWYCEDWNSGAESCDHYEPEEAA